MEKKKDELVTERLRLHAYRERDLGRIAEILCCEEIKKTFMIPDFASDGEAEELAGKLIGFSRSDDHFEYGIYLGEELIGFVNDCGMDGDSIEIGYVVLPEHQGKGYATEAVRACIGELFRMGYREVTAGFFEENVASRRVMEKCGMHRIDEEEDIPYRGAVHRCLYYCVEASE